MERHIDRLINLATEAESIIIDTAIELQKGAGLYD
jgi:hypothetical protein